VTYYQKCKRYADSITAHFDAWKIQDSQPSLWKAIINTWWMGAYISASGRTRESACRRLWETLVEDYGVKEEIS